MMVSKEPAKYMASILGEMETEAKVESLERQISKKNIEKYMYWSTERKQEMGRSTAAAAGRRTEAMVVV